MRPPDQFASAPAEACPFVALDDDRDRRAGGPDPRHRCFAVPVPEPRALAHQQAYCLTPNFPTCPFFIGWAARAAAAPVKAPPGVSGYPASAPAAGDFSPVAAMAGGGYPSAQPQRPVQGQLPPDVGAQAWSGQPGWPAQAPQSPPPPPPPPPAAPTPGATGESYQGSGWNDDGDIFAPPPSAGSPPPPVPSGAGSAPSSAPPSAAASSVASIPVVAAASVSTPPSAPPPFASSSASSAYGSGSPGSFSGTNSPPLATPYGPGVPESASRSTSGSPSSGDADPYPSSADQAGRIGAASVPAYAAATPAPARQQARRPAAAGPADGEWSQGRRSQAYPNLGSRIRFKGVSPLLVGAFALALAALVLFLLPGFLSNHGGGGGGGHRETPTAIAQASETAGEPTPPPLPTPRSYTVKSGDSLTRIAQRFSVTIENIGCYNNLANNNVLQIGQVLLIPPPDYECPSASPSPKKH